MCNPDSTAFREAFMRRRQAKFGGALTWITLLAAGVLWTYAFLIVRGWYGL